MQNEKSKSKNDFRRRTYEFALEIIKLIDEMSRDKTCDIIGNQLLRSATSIGANVAEANGASSKKDYTNFFSYALKSANETKFWLELLRDSGKAKSGRTDRLIAEVTEIANILGASILTLRGKR